MLREPTLTRHTDLHNKTPHFAEVARRTVCPRAAEGVRIFEGKDISDLKAFKDLNDFKDIRDFNTFATAAFGNNSAGLQPALWTTETNAVF